METTLSSFSRYLANETDHEESHSEFGVHITYDDLYASVGFLTAIYVAGYLAGRLFKMPSLVGEIVAGIVLGPSLLSIVPNAEAWVLLGEIGYVVYCSVMSGE